MYRCVGLYFNNVLQEVLEKCSAEDILFGITYDTIVPILTCFTSAIYFGRIDYKIVKSPGAFGVFQDISRMLAFNP